MFHGGSVLGLFIFVLYIDDLSEIFEGYISELLLFADEYKVFSEINIINYIYI